MNHQCGSVLVLTNSLDVTTDLVLRILAKRPVPVVGLDPGTALHSGSTLTPVLPHSRQRGHPLPPGAP